MHAEMKEDGLAVGRHRVARIMRENDLKARQKTRFKKTTDSDHGGPVAPNVLEQDFTAEAPDQKWGVDISYIWTAQGWLYLGNCSPPGPAPAADWSCGGGLGRGWRGEGGAD